MPEIRGSEFDEFAQLHTAIAIHFWASWNGVDPPTDRSIRAISDRFVGRVAFYSCNVDLEQNVSLCKRCGVTAIPTVAVWGNGRLRQLIVGLQEPERLAAEIESRLSEPARKSWWKFFRLTGISCT
jgi:thioredoxin-like negative regulator of GroEL